VRGKSQNWVLERELPAAHRQSAASVSHPCTHTMCWPQGCPGLCSTQARRPRARMQCLQQHLLRRFGGGQCGLGHHWTLTKRRASRLLLLCMCTQHLDAVGSLSVDGYQPVLIPWSWIPAFSGCWSSALFGSSSWHLHYMLSPPGKKRV